MSRARERAPSAGIGWFVTLGGAAVLLAFGFGIGLVAGSALEEPELVAKHLAGEATELPLPEATAPAAPPAAAKPAPAATPGAAAPRARPDAAAPAPAVAPPVERATPKPVAPTRPPPTPAVAARPAGFAIQVGAFADRKAAEELVASLKGDRLRAYVVEGAPTESARFRVRVGPFPTREKAGDEAARIKAKRRLPIWVITEGGA